MSRKIVKEKIFQIEIEDKSYQIKVYFKKIKRLYLRINGKGEFTASVPAHYKSVQIKTFLAQHKDWIVQHSKRINELSAKKEQHKEKTKNKLLYLGEYYPVETVIGKLSKIIFENDTLILQHPDPESIDLENSKEAWLNLQGRNYLRKKFYEVHEQLKEFPLPPVMLQIRKKKRSWGTCYPHKKQIILSKELIKAPEACIEMVIVHELTHLIHPDHSKAFYEQFTKFMPDWKERRELLRKTMHLELEL